MVGWQVLGLVLGAVLASTLLGASAAPVSIQNDLLSLSFDTTSSSLLSVLDVSSGQDMVSPEDAQAVAQVPIWTLRMVDSDDMQEVTSSGRVISDHFITSTGQEQKLSLVWNSVSLYEETYQAYVSVTLDVTLLSDSALSSWSIRVQKEKDSQQSIGMWEVDITVPLSVGSGSDGELFYPSGYGETIHNPVHNSGGSISGLYPSGGVAMQYMALGDSAQNSTSAAFVATLDPTGSIKGFEYSTLAYALSDPVPSPVFHATQRSVTRENEFPPSLQRQQKSDITKLSLLKVTIFAENAGEELLLNSDWKSPFAITVGLVRNIAAAAGRPLWSEAAFIYRSWALREAPWSSHTLSQRGELPDWYRSNPLWVNTHWQCHDIFNVTGGEPAVVMDMVSQISSLFEIPTIALHWYEWQQGPDPAPSKRYKFDTHYPDYFPPRQPEIFERAMEKLRDDFGVYTIPYINGRIFDIESDTYLEDNGNKYCSQYVIKPKLRSASPAENRANLAPYVETYGSDASFCVASPFTSYWQQSLTDTVAELTNDWLVDGVYIDQIGAASPKECYDPIHGHTLGGGTYWTSGYEKMLESIKKAMNHNSDGSLPPIVTENNAEVYMNLLQGYLTLTAFKKSLAQSPSDGKITDYPHIAPAFPMVYGGYYIGFGAEWFLTDFDDSDWFCGKLSAMLMSGSQLGWFSLISIIDDPTDSCGDMGVGSRFLESSSADMVDFVHLLSTERVKVVSYLVDGHLARPVVLQPPAEVLVQTVHSKNKPLLDYDSVSTSTWQLESLNKSGKAAVHTLLMITGNTGGSTYSGEIVVDFSNYGYGDERSLSLEVLSDSAGQSNPSVMSTTLHGPVASIPLTVRPRSLIFLELKPVE